VILAELLGGVGLKLCIGGPIGGDFFHHAPIEVPPTVMILADFRDTLRFV